MQDPNPLPPQLPDEKAKLRAQLLLEVMAGKITATQAAETLDVSRKTWHEWQNRGLEALTGAMQDLPTGRPPQLVDEEKERLRQELRAKEVENAELAQSLRILRLLKLPPIHEALGCKKKP